MIRWYEDENENDMTKYKLKLCIFIEGSMGQIRPFNANVKKLFNKIEGSMGWMDGCVEIRPKAKHWDLKGYLALK